MSNLLCDEWLPVVNSNGESRKIALHNVTAGGSKPYMDVCAPRADFKGAIYQLLIGLLQCNFAPANRQEWKRYWFEPPTPQELQAAFAPVNSLFDICVDEGPAFMQDLILRDGVENSIESLLIDATDSFFNKPGRVKRVSPYWAAIALFTLQINAPSGGRGHRVSLRGGGPLTTLVLPPAGPTAQSLWHRLWLNVLTRQEFSSQSGNLELHQLSAIYPWASATRTSEKKGSATYPEHANPLHMYWSMPRRIRLGKLQAGAGVCDLSGESIEAGISTYMAKSYGYDYSGAWVHPLTPYVIDNAKPPPFSLKGQSGGLGYRHWLGTVMSASDAKTKRQTARVVQAYADSRQEWISEDGFSDDEPSSFPQLWLFAYNLDKMKPLCWYESTLPLMSADAERHDEVVDAVQAMLSAAQDVRLSLQSAVKKAWFSRPKDVKGDTRAIDSNFWQATENDFYSCLKLVIDDDVKKSYASWASVLDQKAHQLFEFYTVHDASASSGGFQRVIDARDGKDGLRHNLNKSKYLKTLRKAGETV